MNPAEQFALDFLLEWAIKFIDRANVRCHHCGFAVWQTAGEGLNRTSIDFVCQNCKEVFCLACGCVDQKPCAKECAGNQSIFCSWIVPGFCSFCVWQIARFVYDEVTGRTTRKHRPYIISRAPLVVAPPPL